MERPDPADSGPAAEPAPDPPPPPPNPPSEPAVAPSNLGEVEFKGGTHPPRIQANEGERND